MTYGKLRLLIQKENPGVDLELIDGYIQNRYTEILDLVPWKRQEAESVIQSPASYSTGMVALTQGSPIVTGTGTTWTPEMTGLMIRIDNQREYYQFAYAGDGVTGELDRDYEAPSGSSLAYRIDQSVFLLPADCRVVRAVRPMHDRANPLERLTPDELDRMAAGRTTYGTPRYYAQTWDSLSDPPQMQIEFYPVPDAPNSSSSLLSWIVDYLFDAGAIDATQTSATLLPWVRPAALQAAVRADCLRLKENWNGAREYEGRAISLVETMLKQNAMQRGPQEIRMAAQYRRPNTDRRWWGSKHPGYTG